jgi:hypothetical protein
VSARLQSLDIHTWFSDLAPPEARWHACLGEYDEGKHVETGPTQRKAVDELLDYHEQNNGEIHQ